MLSFLTLTKLKRRRFQFRLQTLGWIFVVLGLVFAVLAAFYDRARWQRDAVHAVRQSGGEVCDDAAFNERVPFFYPRFFFEPSAPGWLGKLLGNDAVWSVGGVVFPPEAATPKLAGVARLRGVRWLWLMGAKVSDADLAELEGLTGLEVLNLEATDITDQALPALARLRGLRLLNLAYTQVGDKGLTHLERLDRLEELHLVDTRVTAAGVERLHQALPDLAIRWSRAPTEEHRRAAAAITHHRGWIEFEKHPDSLVDRPTYRTGVVELGSRRNVGVMDFCWKGSDADLAQLKQIVGLKSVILSAAIGPAGVAHLRELPDVEELVIKPFKPFSFTNGDLIALAAPPGSMPRLKSLKLRGTSVSDAGLAHVRNWMSLESLDLTGLSITEHGLRHLKGMTNLRELKLSGEHLGQVTGVADAALAEIAELRSLTKLFVDHTRITDAGLAHLAGLKQLEQLDLFDTKISDAGLVHLKGLNQLRELNLSETQVTGAGVPELQNAMPNCKIFWRYNAGWKNSNGAAPAR